MKKDTKITIRQTPEMADKLKLMADKEGLSQSDIVAKALEAYEESQAWRNPYYQCNRLYSFISDQIQELQYLDEEAEQNGVDVSEEMQEYIQFINTKFDEIRNLKAFWEPRFLLDDAGDFITGKDFQPVLDEEWQSKKPF